MIALAGVRRVSRVGLRRFLTRVIARFLNPALAGSPASGGCPEPDDLVDRDDLGKEEMHGLERELVPPGVKLSHGIADNKRLEVALESVANGGLDTAIGRHAANNETVDPEHLQ